MVSTYTTNKSLEKPGNGDYVGTWNVPVNGDMDAIDQAFGGVTSLNASTGSVTLIYSQYRSLFFKVSGAITANVIYTIPSGVGGQWIVYNTTTDSGGGPFAITFASGGAGLSVNVPRNSIAQIISDGTNVYSIVNSGGGSSTFSRTSFTATAGQTSFTMIDPIGLTAGTLVTIYDGANTEQVTISSTYTYGSSTINITSALKYTHASGVAVGNMPQAIKQAAILLTTDFLKVRGDNSLTMAVTTRATSGPSVQSIVGSDIELAKMLLSPFRRMR